MKNSLSNLNKSQTDINPQQTLPVLIKALIGLLGIGLLAHVLAVLSRVLVWALKPLGAEAAALLYFVLYLKKQNVLYYAFLENIVKNMI